MNTKPKNKHSPHATSTIIHSSSKNNPIKKKRNTMKSVTQKTAQKISLDIPHRFLVFQGVIILLILIYAFS